MHPKTLILSLFAAGVVATPVKRDYVVETDIDTVTEVVVVTRTAGVPLQTHHRHHHHHHHHHNSPVPVVTTTLTPSTPTPAAPAPEHKHKGHKHHHKKPAPVPEPEHHHKHHHHHLPEAGTEDYATIATIHHNVHRDNHSAPHIHWDSGLAATALKIAQTCIYEHNTEMDGGGYGQNIAAGVAANNISEIITGMFYNGEVAAYDDCYGEANPPNFEEWGHFSQVVWKATTHFGCATYDCGTGGLANVASDVPAVFTVCNYKSPGNVYGEYGTQVGDSLNHPTVEWNYRL